MTRSADMMHDIRPRTDNARIDDSRMIRYGGIQYALTIVFPGNLTVKLLDVAHVPDLSYNLFSRRGVGSTTEDSRTCISLFDGRLGFEGDGSSYSGFGCRIEPDDCCVCLLYTSPSPRD